MCCLSGTCSHAILPLLIGSSSNGSFGIRSEEEECREKNIVLVGTPANVVDMLVGLHRISGLYIRYPAGYPVSFAGYPVLCVGYLARKNCFKKT